MERTALIYNKGVWEPGCFGDLGALTFLVDELLVSGHGTDGRPSAPENSTGFASLLGGTPPQTK